MPSVYLDLSSDFWLKFAFLISDVTKKKKWTIPYTTKQGKYEAHYILDKYSTS